MSNAFEGTYDDPANPQPRLTREDRFCDITGIVDDDGEPSRWLLVQEHLHSGERYYETFTTARSALEYAGDLGELTERWDPREVWDLDTGQRYEVRVLADPILGLREVPS